MTVKKGSDTTKVFDMVKAASGKVRYVLMERKMMVKDYTKITNRGYSVNSIGLSKTNA
jgi:hypothetical protein